MKDVMAKKNIHTTYDSSKHTWKTLVEGQSKPIKTARTKKRAMKNSVVEAKRRSVEHIIHNRDGKISEKDSYGNDPFPPKG